MLMPGRQYGGLGRYGFNGKENDNEVKDEGNQQDYGLRVYDTRLGRFLSVDPLDKKFPYWSPYHFSGSSPIRFIDLDGGEILDPFTKWVLTDAAITITKQPTSTKAKVYGALIGVGGAVEGAGQGAINLVVHPVESAKGLRRVLNNSTAENMADVAIRLHQTYGELPDPVKSYAVGSHLFTEIAIAAEAFKGPLKSTGMKLSAELPAGTQVAGFISRAGSNLFKKVSEFKLTHSVETITKSADYQAISKLSDAELINSVTKPKDLKMVTENTETGKLFDGNTRIYELQRRKINIDVPYREYTPDNSMFPNFKEPPKKQ